MCCHLASEFTNIFYFVASGNTISFLQLANLFKTKWKCLTTDLISCCQFAVVVGLLLLYVILVQIYSHIFSFVYKIIVRIFWKPTLKCVIMCDVILFSSDIVVWQMFFLENIFMFGLHAASWKWQTLFVPMTVNNNNYWIIDLSLKCLDLRENYLVKIAIVKGWFLKDEIRLRDMHESLS